VLKDTWLACLDPKSGQIRTVILVDQAFRVLNGLENTGVKNGLLIENSSRSLLVKCYNEKRAHEWRLSLMQMALSTGEKFFNTQRFGSFAPQRENSHVKWFVDGQDYMDSIANTIEIAKEEIFITGFFLTPEIYLKRPVIQGEKWRLDKLLKRKAEQGVKVYVLIYKEIELTLPINSAYSKRILTLAHKNIKVLRHPDHINEPNKFLAIMWAHHEKVVVVDQTVAYFGGIDLSYGRWDNHSHR
jgi:phospholipase D1/2